MMVIGVDAHKATHTAAAVNRQTAELLGQHTVDARQHGHDQLLAWARDLDDDRIWAIEDARTLSGRLERDLLEAGEQVLRVPPKLMARERKATRSFSKSDPIDALAIARAAIREPDLPKATLPGIEHEIGLLVDHRNDLVGECTNHQRRLRWHLHELDPDLHVPPSGLTNDSCSACPKARKFASAASWSAAFANSTAASPS
jgi:transposase